MAQNLIIGGGLIGVTTALELLARNEDVMLLEAGNGVGEGASFANGGLLTPSMADPWNSPGVHRHLLEFLISSKSALKIRFGALPSLVTWGPHFLWNSAPARHEATTRANLSLARYSLAVLEQLRRDHGFAFEGARHGALKVFRTQESLDAAARLTEMLGALGLVADTISSERAVAIEPTLAPVGNALCGAIHYPGDATGDAHLFTRLAADRVRALGGEILLQTRAEAVERRGGRVIGVRAGGRLIAADRVIVAGGAASPALVTGFGLKIRVKPVKGYSVTYWPGPRHVLPRMPVIDDAYHSAVTPIGERLRVAGTAEFAGPDVRLDPVRVDNLSRLIQAIFPAIADRETLATGKPWAGLRPVSADGRPYIGRGACDNLWVNAGHGHLGWTMAAGSARLLADLIQGQAPEVDPEPFRATR